MADRDPQSTSETLAPKTSKKSPDFIELREILVGAERRELEEIKRRLDTLGITPDKIAEQLPEAITLRSGRDAQLSKALAPTLDAAVHDAVRSKPNQIVEAIYPILGPAIRKAIAQALAGLAHSINRAIEHSLSWQGLKWRLESWRTGVPFSEVVIKHALVYRVEQLFLVHAETGLLLSHVTISSIRADDPDLISGMLTAIRDFVQDSFGERDSGLHRFSVGEVSIIVEQGPRAVLAAVVRGVPPEQLSDRLQAVLETIHLQFGTALRDFEGDSSAVEPAQPLLTDLLETVVSTDRASGRSLTRRMMWVLLVLIPLAFAVVAFRSQRRWQSAVTLLSSEPGIVVVDADRGFRRWRFAGLKDPHAPDPKVLLASTLQIDTTRIDATWAPYLSFEPSLIGTRARRTLNAPSTVDLAVRSDTLVATGTAPTDWIRRAGTAGTAVAGISAINLEGVEPEPPATLTDLKGDIERERVYFRLGSAFIDTEQLARLQRVIGSLQRLEALAADEGYDVEVELVGRTDTTGTEAVNQTLSQMRADTVRATVWRSGLSAASIATTGIGTTQPLRADDAETQARINRSASFVIAFRLQRRPDGQ